MGESYISSAVFMDTLITIEVVDPASVTECAERVNKAFGWFDQVERHCTRFDETSELSRLSGSFDVQVRVSALLYSIIEFAMAVARASHGAFDPTIGHRMEENDFNVNYHTGERTRSKIDRPPTGSYRDVRLDQANSSVTLLKPAVLDLGALAKGFATDLAAAELRGYMNYAINAGVMC